MFYTLSRKLCYVKEGLRIAHGVPLRVLFTRQGHPHCYAWVIWNSFWMWNFIHVTQGQGANYHYWNEETGKGDLST